MTVRGATLNEDRGSRPERGFDEDDHRYTPKGCKWLDVCHQQQDADTQSDDVRPGCHVIARVHSRPAVHVVRVPLDAWGAHQCSVCTSFRQRG
jgi:hypothetical protein